MAGLLFVVYMTVKLDKISFVRGSDTYVLYARFTSVSGRKVCDPVEIFGIKIGQVEHLEMDQKDEMAVVELRINKGIKTYKDANASIKTIGLIGQRYVSIDPGGAASLIEPGGMITQTEPPYRYQRPDRGICLWKSKIGCFRAFSVMLGYFSDRAPSRLR